MQFHALPTAFTATQFETALQTVLNDGSLNVQLTANGMPGVISTTVQATTLNLAAVNATLTNWPAGSLPPFVNSFPAFEIRVETNSPNTATYTPGQTKFGLPQNGHVKLTFPDDPYTPPVLQSVGDWSVTVRCEGTCAGWTGPVVKSGGWAGFSVQSGVTAVLGFTADPLPAAIANGDHLVLHFAKGFILMPSSCEGHPSWVYVLRTGDSTETIMFWVGNPDDRCTDLCSACEAQHDTPDGTQHLCQIYDIEQGWRKFRSGPVSTSCQRCNPSGQTSNMHSRSPMEPVTGDCSLP